MHRLVAVALASVLLLAAPASARAGCGNETIVEPTRTVVENRAPLFVGDSVLLGATGEIAAAGFKVNARGCRSFQDGLGVLRRYRHAHRLPHLVVLQLGTNWSVSRKQIRTALTITGHGRVLALLTPRGVGGFGGPDAAAVRRARTRWPDRVVLLDWVAFSKGRDTWFQPDGIHLTATGASELAGYVRREALPFAPAGVMPSPLDAAAGRAP